MTCISEICHGDRMLAALIKPGIQRHVLVACFSHLCCTQAGPRTTATLRGSHRLAARKKGGRKAPCMIWRKCPTSASFVTVRLYRPFLEPGMFGYSLYMGTVAIRSLKQWRNTSYIHTWHILQQLAALNYSGFRTISQNKVGQSREVLDMAKQRRIPTRPPNAAWSNSRHHLLAPCLAWTSTRA